MSCQTAAPHTPPLPGRSGGRKPCRGTPPLGGSGLGEAQVRVTGEKAEQTLGQPLAFLGPDGPSAAAGISPSFSEKRNTGRNTQRTPMEKCTHLPTAPRTRPRPVGGAGRLWGGVHDSPCSRSGERSRDCQVCLCPPILGHLRLFWKTSPDRGFPVIYFTRVQAWLERGK